mgnify:CR=1 FL=1
MGNRRTHTTTTHVLLGRTHPSRGCCGCAVVLADRGDAERGAMQIDTELPRRAPKLCTHVVVLGYQPRHQVFPRTLLVGQR